MSDVSTSRSSLLRRGLFAGGFALLGAVGTLGLQAAAFPGPSGGRAPGGHPGMLIHALLDGVVLSDEQQDSLRDLRDDMRDERSTWRSQREADLDRIGALVTADDLDRDAVHAEIDRRAADRIEMVHEVADRLMDFQATLTAEQRGQVGDNMEDFKQHVADRHAGLDDEPGPRRGRRGR